MRSPVVITPPTFEPVTLAEAKAHLREDLSDPANDVLISACIAAAREHVEAQTGRRMIQQTLRCFASGWPIGAFQLPVAPVSSIVHIRYYDTDDVAYTWPATEYSYNGSANPPVILRRYLKTYPSVTLRPLDPIEIQFVAGVPTPPEVNPRLRQAVLMLMATLYRHPETVTISNTTNVATLIPQHFNDFLASFRVWS
jgi:uncharacterized phiE125 gp8 family phage protein